MLHYFLHYLRVFLHFLGVLHHVVVVVIVVAKTMQRLLPLLLCGRRRLLGHLLRLAGLLVPPHPQRQRLLVHFISFITTPENVANTADAGHGARAVHRLQVSATVHQIATKDSSKIK